MSALVCRVMSRSIVSGCISKIVLKIRRDAHGLTAAVAHLRHVVEPLGILDEDLVAGVEQHQKQSRDSAPMPPLVMMISVAGS